jgi:hypothetical protein
MFFIAHSCLTHNKTANTSLLKLLLVCAAHARD